VTACCAVFLAAYPALVYELLDGLPDVCDFLAADVGLDVSCAGTGCAFEVAADAVHEDGGPEVVVLVTFGLGWFERQAYAPVFVAGGAEGCNDPVVGELANASGSVLLHLDRYDAVFAATKRLDDVHAVGDVDTGKLVLSADGVPAALFFVLDDVIQ
jgi:hypothetical protein